MKKQFVRIFSGRDEDLLQQEINRFLRDNPNLTVVDAMQSQSWLMDLEGDFHFNLTITLIVIEN